MPNTQRNTFVEAEFISGEIMMNYAEGPVTGPPVVMLHGLTGNWKGYLQLMTRLSPHWHVLACDLRGHGKSGRAGDRYRLADYARDIVAFLRAQTEPAVLVGHSLGGLVALAVAASIPERTRALVLLDPGLVLRSMGFLRSFVVGLLPGAARVFGYLAWVRKLKRSPLTQSEVEAACRRHVPGAGPEELEDLVERVWCVAPEAVEVLLRGRLLKGVDLSRVARTVTQPALLLYGEIACGGAVRERDVRWLKTLIPSLRANRIPGGSHLFLWEQPEVTIGSIEEFLAGLRRAHDADAAPETASIAG